RNDKGFKLLDKTIVANLQPGQDTNKLKLHITARHFLNTSQVFKKSLNDLILFSKLNKDLYHQVAIEKYNAEIRSKELKQDNSFGNRANYIIKHTNYSEAVAEFRTSLFQLTHYFNRSIINKLKPAASGIPYPELEDANQVLSQEKQVALIKR